MKPLTPFSFKWLYRRRLENLAILEKARKDGGVLEWSKEDEKKFIES